MSDHANVAMRARELEAYFNVVRVSHEDCVYNCT